MPKMPSSSGMSLAYPLAMTVEEALTGAQKAARTRYDAEVLAEGQSVMALETEWVKPGPDDVAVLLKQAESGEAKGFIQIYEDADGAPVLAVTYWKLGAPVAGKQPTPAKVDKPKAEKPARTEKAGKAEEDHTDDLYFRHGRTRKSRRKRHVDPRQMDLFTRPDQRGYEHEDPNNPNTMLTDEEGDGTTFGG